MNKLRFCEDCEEYTLDKKHYCNTQTINPHPAKWSPEDKYGEYRRKAKLKKLYDGE